MIVFAILDGFCALKMGKKNLFQELHVKHVSKMIFQPAS